MNYFVPYYLHGNFLFTFHFCSSYTSLSPILILILPTSLKSLPHIHNPFLCSTVFPIYKLIIVFHTLLIKVVFEVVVATEALETAFSRVGEAIVHSPVAAYVVSITQIILWCSVVV
jgi:hypothetical protein